MNSKIRIFTMVCAALLIVGCENNTPSSATETTPTATPAATETVSAETSPAQVKQSPLFVAQGAPAELSTTTSQVNAAPKATVVVPVVLKNISAVEFMTGVTDDRVEFFWEILDAEGKSLGQQGAPLSSSLAAGQTATYQLSVLAPAVAGQYTININMLQQGRFFFKDAGVKSAIVTLDVK